MSKEKSKLARLPKIRFIKMVADRAKKVKNTPADELPDILSYKANALAAALHPKAQFVKVQRVIEFSKDIKSYILVPDEENGTRELAYFSAGSYISVSLEFNGMKLTRPYSLASSPRDALKGEYMITVKRVNGGTASEYILDNWNVGTKIKISAPEGQFTYEPLRDGKTVVGIAGGSGITPFRSLAYSIAEGDEDCNLILLYGTNTLREAVFEDEFKALEKSCKKIKIINILSGEKIDGYENGFITAEIIKKYAPKAECYSIFLCGPQVMYEFTDKETAKLNIKKKYIRHELLGEYFNPSKEADYPKNTAKKYKLKVHIGEKEYDIISKPDESILRTLESNGIAAPAHCRSGECGWCHSQLISGKVYTPKSVDGRRAADIDFGYIHPCCTFPLSDIEIDVPPVTD